MATAEQPEPIRSRADAIKAGRRHARERGDQLTPTQIVQIAALLRPYLDDIKAAASDDTAA